MWVILVSACSGSEDEGGIKANDSAQIEIKTYNEVQWIDLLPKADLDAIMNPPSYITDIVDGSIEDQIANQVQNSIVLAQDDRYQQALKSVDIIEEMDGQLIKIPGFIVPLQYDVNQNITEFFIVPYFGACIHVPPPPPNQILYVKYPEGFQLDDWNRPFWFFGELNTQLVENEMATSAYSLNVSNIEVYQD
tara:strand:- start:670 stop:1245 length:576 start_codon:yes stop_codon:yes gene_type:complete